MLDLVIDDACFERAADEFLKMYVSFSSFTGAIPDPSFRLMITSNSQTCTEQTRVENELSDDGCMPYLEPRERQSCYQ